MEGMLTPADIAVLSGNRGNNSGFGNGDMGAWWIIIFLIFAFGGWGNGGFGNNGGGSSAAQGALTREQACIDNNFQNLMRETASISDAVNLGFANLNSTICNQQYDTARMINGVDMNIMQGNFGLQTAVNGVSSQLAQCCCDLRSEIATMNFNNAQNTCAITNAISTSTRDIVDNQNANYRALHDEMVAIQIENKNNQIAAQQNEINKLQLAASQERQNAYLVSELAPKFPVPAYLTCNPYTGQVYGGTYGYGYNNGCGCGC